MDEGFALACFGPGLSPSLHLDQSLGFLLQQRSSEAWERLRGGLRIFHQDESPVLSEEELVITSLCEIAIIEFWSLLVNFPFFAADAMDSTRTAALMKMLQSESYQWLSEPCGQRSTELLGVSSFGIFWLGDVQRQHANKFRMGQNLW